MNKTLVTGGAVRNGNKFTLQEGIEYIHLLFSKNDGSDITADEIANADLMIEKGDTATDYIEHEQTDYILDIQQEMLKGDCFVKEEDGWKEVHNFNNKILTGDEEYKYVATTNVFYTDVFTDKELGKDNFISTHFKVIASFNYTTMQRGETTGDTNKNNRIIFKYPDVTTEADFKAKIKEQYNAGTPVKFYYKLATPTKLACTEAQSAVLEELSNLELFDGINNIITTEDIALLKLKYALDVKTYVNNLIASQAKTEEA